MKKNILLIVLFTFCFSESNFAQNDKTKAPIKTISSPDTKPELGDALAMIYRLQNDNKVLQQQVADLKTQLSALQTQVNANYKLLDYSLGKLSKSAPVAFTVVAGPQNLTDLFKPASGSLPGNYYRSVIIDNAACNNNPDALVIVTQQPSGFGYNLPTGIAVQYDGNIGKWKIVINPHETNPQIMGLAKPTTGSYMVSVAEYSPYQINNGDKFNVLVLK
jgi:hypothetical protein